MSEAGNLAGGRSRSLAERFSLVESVLLQGQQLTTVSPNERVQDALEVMRRHGYSQLPIVTADGSVHGVFSYRSLASALRVPSILTMLDRAECTVMDAREHPTFVQPWDRWDSMVKALDQYDYALVGTPSGISGIVTATDMLNYLNEKAAPFVLLSAIELTVRDIISEVLDEAELVQCIETVNARVTDGHQLPAVLEDMTFAQYGMLIRHPQVWPRFEAVFGQGEGQRAYVASRLGDIARMRNDAFHFREGQELADRSRLSEYADWLESRLRAYRAAKTSPPTSPARGKPGVWTEERFFADARMQQDPVSARVARRIFDWAVARGLKIYWGKGKTYGSFVSAAPSSNGATSLFAIRTTGQLELYLLYLGRRDPFRSDAVMGELVRRFNTFEGVRLPPDAAERYPKVPLSVFAGEECMSELESLCDWMISMIEGE